MNTDVPYSYSVSFIPYHTSADMSTRADIQTVLYTLCEIAVFIENWVSWMINGLKLQKKKKKKEGL